MKKFFLFFILMSFTQVIVAQNIKVHNHSVFADAMLLTAKSSDPSFSAGVGYQYYYILPVVNNLGIVASAEFCLSFLDSQKKKSLDETYAPMASQVSSRFKDSYKSSAYPRLMYIPIMAGVNYSYPIKDNLSIFGEFKMGPDFIINTPYKGHGTYSYTQKSASDRQTRRDTYNGDVSISARSKLSICFSTSLSAGVVIKDHYAISLCWMYLGSPSQETNIEVSYSTHRHYWSESSTKWKDSYDSDTMNSVMKSDKVAQNSISLRFAFLF